MPPTASTCTWHCQRRQPHEPLDEETVRQTAEVFRGAFGFEPAGGVESVRRRLQHASALGLLRDSAGIVQGFACYTAPDAPLDGAHVLWGDGIALAPAVQGRGLSLDVIERVCALFPDRSFGWMGGRTQNPVVFRRYARFGRVFPFDETYASGEGRALLAYLQKHVAEVSELAELDPVSGICPRAYRWSHSPEYLAKITGAEPFEAQLRRFNFNRAAGDAVIVSVKLTKPIRANAR